jgi:acetolactate synthase-1/3 small subunit
VIVEIAGDKEKVDGLVDLLRPRGIVEMVRTGKIAMVRGGSEGAEQVNGKPAETAERA